MGLWFKQDQKKDEGNIEKKKGWNRRKKKDEGRVDEIICKEGWMKDKGGNLLLYILNCPCVIFCFLWLL